MCIFLLRRETRRDPLLARRFVRPVKESERRVVILLVHLQMLLGKSLAIFETILDGGLELLPGTILEFSRRVMIKRTPADRVSNLVSRAIVPD